MRRARNILAVFTLALACWLLVEATLLIREARTDLFEVSFLVNDNLLYARGTMTEIQAASQEWAATAKEQRQYWQKNSVALGLLLADTRATIHQANLLIQRLDDNLNNALLPEATKDLRLLGETLETLRATGQALQKVAEDPENERVRQEAIALLEQTRGLTAQGEKTLAEWEKVAAEVKKVPPVARKALWVQIIVALLTALR